MYQREFSRKVDLWLVEGGGYEELMHEHPLRSVKKIALITLIAFFSLGNYTSFLYPENKMDLEPDKSLPDKVLYMLTEPGRALRNLG